MDKIVPFLDKDVISLKDVIDSMTDLQRQVLYHIVGQAWTPKPDAPLFIKYYAQIGFCALNVANDEFIAIQRLQADILNSYKFGNLSDPEYRILYNAATTVMGYMRKELQGNGTKENQDGSD